MTPSRKFIQAGVWCLGFFILTFTILIANIYRHGVVSDIPKADTIIVLGAAQWDGAPSPIFQARLDLAHKLYTQGYATSIIVTGGKIIENPQSDSSVGKAYLIRNGINADRIFTEEHSRTTLQNLISAREIMESQNLQSAILISHDFHMMRAQQMAKGLGMTVFPAPTKTKDKLSKLRYATREAVMHIAYIFFHI